MDGFEKNSEASFDADYHDSKGSVDGDRILDGVQVYDSLRFRDIRTLDFAYNPTLEPDLIIRRHCVIMIFDPIRAFIMADRVILIVPPDADNLLMALDCHLRGQFDIFHSSSDYVD